MKIANIISNNIILPEWFNVVSSLDDIIENIPTLIIGYDYVNKHYPDFNITDYWVESNLYWIFKKSENRDKHNEGLNWFISKTYSDLIRGVDYIFIDPINHKPKTLWKIIRKIKSLSKIVSYVYNDMIYIYGEKLIFGVDLKLLKFMGLDVFKIKNKIKDISSVFLDDDTILIEYKKNVEPLANKVRYVPYLYSILNEKKDTTSLIYIPRTS